jgi:AcrR family transcriptional regulator
MADQPLTSRGAATYQRILDVAIQEFAEHGIAGARVERIVAGARTNKAQLYAYFGSKEGLFDAIFFGSLERIVNVVPIDAADLADWAVRLYDEYLRRPDLVRQGDPFDVMAVVIAMSMAWSPVSNVYAATAQEPPELHERRRALLRESVHRAMTAD